METLILFVVLSRLPSSAVTRSTEKIFDCPRAKYDRRLIKAWEDWNKLTNWSCGNEQKPNAAGTSIDKTRESKAKMRDNGMKRKRDVLDVSSAGSESESETESDESNFDRISNTYIRIKHRFLLFLYFIADVKLVSKCKKFSERFDYLVKKNEESGLNFFTESFKYVNAKCDRSGERNVGAQGE